MPNDDACRPDIEHLFLYGTLMRGGAAHASFSLHERLAHVADASVRGRLYDLGGYPGLVDGDGRVKGEVHRILDPAVLAELDRYEACDPLHEETSEYVRRAIALPALGIEAWVYLYRGPLDRAVPLATSRWRTRTPADRDARHAH